MVFPVYGSNIHFFQFFGKRGYREIMVKVFPSYGIIIAGHFCNGMTIYVSFLEQYLREKPRALKIFNDLPRQQKAPPGLNGGG
jgi:hypothetical protein